MYRLALLALVASACRSAPAPTPAEGMSAPTVEDLVRVRCATDGRDVVTTWTGSIYAAIPNTAPVHVFDVMGMNVARCARDADGWYITSRELMLYLDPDDGVVLHRWRNPWTGVEVPVVHVANSPVQGRLSAAPPLERHGTRGTFRVEYTPTYPNPLAADPALQPYSTGDTYAAIEMFGLSAPAADVTNPTLPQVSELAFTWHRVGPWLPWMAQGDRPGTLVYSARGHRVTGIGALPAPLRDEIRTRLPRYATAPRCYLPVPNATSWRYFAEHLAAYQQGARFPLEAPIDADECAH